MKQETERTKLLKEAEEIVNRDRNNTYGNPEDNFWDIAQLWHAYKGVQFTMMDVAIMNILIKIARLKKTPNYRDGLVDIAGYAACGADIQAKLPRTAFGLTDAVLEPIPTETAEKFIQQAKNMPPLIAGETIAEYCDRIRSSQPPT